MISDNYWTINAQFTSELKEKGSRFIATAFPIVTEKEFDTILTKIKGEHHKANHHCYAFRLGPEGDLSRSNDDGEPSGTAGKPILGQLISKKLTNCAVTVVRYFGGTKLGVSGLINAYKESARLVLPDDIIITKTITKKFRLSFNYDFMGKIMYEIERASMDIISKDFNDICVLTVEIPRSEAIKKIAQFKATLLGVSIDYITDNTIVPFCSIIILEE